MVDYYQIEDYKQKIMERKSESEAGKFRAKQVFGSIEGNQISDEDVITSLKFDPTGQFLCLGDNQGRIIIFRESNDSPTNDYEYFAEFQSHYLSMDFLSSRQVFQGIVDICWLNPQGRFLKMLTSNSHIIKLWRCGEKVEKNIIKAPDRGLSIPKFQKEEPIFSAAEIKIFPKVHQTPINSISTSKNEEYLLSSGEEKCFFWNIEKGKQPYSAYDIVDKKKVVSNLQITCSKMHPSSDSLFVAGMNQNSLTMCDLRQSNSGGRAIDFGVETHSMKNFFTDMVSSVGSTEFCQNGKYIISRQYLNVKIWDITQTRKPLLNICTQDSLKSKLVELFEKQHIYDKFEISGSPDNNTVLTGNYNNSFHCMDVRTGQNYQYEVNFQNQTKMQQIIRGKTLPLGSLDMKRKITANCFHPNGKMAALSLLNCFFIYSL